jgi:hypothetical protein
VVVWCGVGVSIPPLGLTLAYVAGSQKWSYDEFVAVWGESLPDGVTPDLSLLEACGRWGFFGFKVKEMRGCGNSICQQAIIGACATSRRLVGQQTI